MEAYEFESANKGTVTFEITGAYADGTVDLDVTAGDFAESYDEIDAGGVEDVFADLMASGVEFESTRSLWANVHIVASVMIDQDATVADVLDRAARKTDAELDEWRGYAF